MAGCAMSADVDVVRMFRRGLPDYVWTSVRNNQAAVAAIVKAVEQGWTVRELLDQVADLGTVSNAGAVLVHRLQRCADIDKRRRSVPQWCGRVQVCDRTTRHLLDHNRLPGPERCPVCHPLASSPQQPTDTEDEQQ